MADFWGVIKGALKAVRRWARTCCASCRAPASVAILILAGLCPQQSHAQDSWDQSAVNLCLNYLQDINTDTHGIPQIWSTINNIWGAYQIHIIDDLSTIAASAFYTNASEQVRYSAAEATTHLLGVTRNLKTDVTRELQTMNGYLDDIWYYIENGLIGGGGGGDTNVLNSILWQLTTDSQNDVQTLRSLVDEIADITTEGVYTNSYYFGEITTKVGQMNTTLNNLKTNSDNLKNTVARVETILNSIKDSLTSDGKSVAEYEKLVWAYLTTTTPDGKSFKGSINDILVYCATNSIALQEISDQLSLNNYAMTNLSSVLQGLTTNLLASATNDFTWVTNSVFKVLGFSYVPSNVSSYFSTLIGSDYDILTSIQEGFDYTDFNNSWQSSNNGFEYRNDWLNRFTETSIFNSYLDWLNLVYNYPLNKSNNDIIIDSFNTITNKFQSVPYTVIYPAAVTASGGLPAIYPALTNAYINSWQQQSDMTWFDRIETLLAALVFESAANNQNTNGNGNSWGLDAGGGGTGSIESSYGQYQTGVGGLQTLVGNYRSSAIGLLSNIQSKFSSASNTGIEWQTGIDNQYFAIDTSNTFFQIIRTCAIICWSCGFLFIVVKLFAFVSPFLFKGFKLAFNIVSALIMGG